jgi:isoleucyl-tRNA synthetase
VHLDEALCAHIAGIFAREGADAWFDRDTASLAPPGFACGGCGGTSFAKDTSILDVWFESGASFWSTMRDEAAGLGVPVDLYLEGSDQHRGWFHSSLLVGCAVLGRAPYKRVLTHGFVCDDQGKPYSKSDLQRRREAGEKVEYIEPASILEGKGAELLRLWVAYEDFRNDVRFSAEHLKQVSDGYFKVRNTLRFLLGNLAGRESHGAAPTEDPTAIDPLDRWARARLARYLADVVGAYERFDFRAVYHRTVEICAGDWSVFYLDVVKDRLYCDAVGAPRRISCQATLNLIARSTIAALAPLAPFTADEAWRHLPGAPECSVFLGARLEAPAFGAAEEALLAAGRTLLSVRDAINLSLEPKIQSKEIPHRREVAVRLTLPEATARELAMVAPDLADAFAVASVEVAGGDAVRAEVTRTAASGCARCWRHRADVGTVQARSDLCVRCAAVVGSGEVAA